MNHSLKNPVRIIMPMVFNTDIDEVVLEGGANGMVSVEYHIIGTNVDISIDENGGSIKSGFNFNSQNNATESGAAVDSVTAIAGLFEEFMFRQDPTVGNDNPRFYSRVDNFNKWKEYISKDRFEIANLGTDDLLGKTPVYTNPNSIRIMNTRNAFLGPSVVDKLPLRRVGLHMVSDCIFGTPLALAAIQNNSAIESSIENQFSNNLKEFFNQTDQIEDILNTYNGCQTTSLYWGEGSNTQEQELYNAHLFSTWKIESNQHKVMKYIFDQLRIQVPERFTSSHYNLHSNNNRNWNVDANNQPTGSGQYNPLTQYENFPFVENDTIVMFMRPKVDKLFKISFGHLNNFMGSTNNDSGHSLLSINGKIDTNGNPMTSKVIPDTNDDDGMLLAIELRVNQHSHLARTINVVTKFFDDKVIDFYTKLCAHNKNNVSTVEFNALFNTKNTTVNDFNEVNICAEGSVCEKQTQLENVYQNALQNYNDTKSLPESNTKNILLHQRIVYAREAFLNTTIKNSHLNKLLEDYYAAAEIHIKAVTTRAVHLVTAVETLNSNIIATVSSAKRAKEEALAKYNEKDSEHSNAKSAFITTDQEHADAVLIYDELLTRYNTSNATKAELDEAETNLQNANIAKTNANTFLANAKANRLLAAYVLKIASNAVTAAVAASDQSSKTGIDENNALNLANIAKDAYNNITSITLDDNIATSASNDYNTAFAEFTNLGVSLDTATTALAAVLVASQVTELPTEPINESTDEAKELLIKNAEIEVINYLFELELKLNNTSTIQMAYDEVSGNPIPDDVASFTALKESLERLLNSINSLNNFETNIIERLAIDNAAMTVHHRIVTVTAELLEQEAREAEVVITAMLAYMEAE